MPAPPLILRALSLSILCLGFLLHLPGAPLALASTLKLYPIPQEVRSSHYTVAINGQQTPVMHAASRYYLLNFDADFSRTGPLTLSITAPDPHFWDRGVEVQPMRLGIRPVQHGATITFRLDAPGKLTISRPGDHFAEADMLFLFANPPETSGIHPRTPGVRYYGPGVHRGSIDARSGDTIYLDGAAVVFGSLNLWQVHDVHVLGRGTLVYDGPQTPDDDTGWMHRRDWHSIVMDEARNIEIDGITAVVRSRTWQVQMKNSRHIGFFNVKIVAGSRSDANQDGLDWLGGGDTTVRDCFFRTSDDVFAIYSSWDGYSEAAMHAPGPDVTNISIEDTVASASISNILRVGWPEKTGSSAHITLRNMDIEHTGYGDCKVPFAFFELWADPNGVGTHRDYTFDKIRLEDWYSLYQIRYPNPGVRDVRFSGVWAMDGPGMAPSVLKGNVREVTLRDAPGNAPTTGELRPQVLDGAQPPVVEPAAINNSYRYTNGLLRPGQPVEFTAGAPEAPGRRYQWLFGDGTGAQGRMVRHAFGDTEGTLLDGSGRFRVLLHVTDANGAETWGSQPVVVARRALPAAGGSAGGRVFDVPADGGYTLTVLLRSTGTVSLDGLPPVAAPVPRPLVCGSTESSAQPVRISAALMAGPHRLRITAGSAADNAGAVMLWEGPDLAQQPLPAR